MPNFVRLQCLLLALYRILLFVLKRIQCGIGLFCLAFLASVLLVRNVFYEGILTTIYLTFTNSISERGKLPTAFLLCSQY